MVQLVQLCCALEGLGFEPAGRSALASAKACCRCQSLGQRLVQQARRIAPGQQVGDDYQYDGEGNGQAQPEKKTQQRFFRRANTISGNANCSALPAVAGWSARPST